MQRGQGQSPWSGRRSHPEAESSLVIRCPTEPANLATTAKSSMQSKRSLRTDYGFINNNEFILPKTICFVTVHWYQSWGAQSAWCPSTPSLGGGLCLPPASPAPPPMLKSRACVCGHRHIDLRLNYMVTKVDSSLEYFRTTVTAAAVCLQRRRSSRVLRKKVGAHNSTPPLSTSAESSRENSVPVMRSHASLPYRHRAVIPSTQLNSTENYGRRCLTPLSPHRNYILS